MTNNERASGTITLPAAAVAPFRRAVNTAANRLHEEVLASAKAAHANIKTRSPKLYEQAVHQWTDKAYRETHVSAHTATVRELTHMILLGLATKPHAPTRADVDRYITRATNRTGDWHGMQWGITLEGRTLTISYDGNHSADAFAEHPVSAAAMTALSAVKWTRGTGGVLWYNSEYNEGPSGNSWGGGDRISEAWGPDGERTRDLDRGFSIVGGKFTPLRG